MCLIPSFPILLVDAGPECSDMVTEWTGLSWFADCRLATGSDIEVAKAVVHLDI